MGMNPGYPMQPGAGYWMPPWGMPYPGWLPGAQGMMGAAGGVAPLAGQPPLPISGMTPLPPLPTGTYPGTPSVQSESGPPLGAGYGVAPAAPAGPGAAPQMMGNIPAGYPPYPPYGTMPYAGWPFMGAAQATGSGADPGTKKAKGKPPSKFTGAEKTNVSWEEWERKFLNHMRNVEKNPPEEWVSLLWTYLEGDAERAFLAIIGDRDPSEVPYEEVTRGMAAGPFPKAKTRHALLSELRGLKMENRREGYDAYQHKFTRILGELAQTNYKPDPVNLCVDFLNGLVSAMRFELQVRKPEG